MPELYYIDDTSLATGRVGIGPLQCMRPLPQASWHSSAHISQDRRNQKSQSRQNCRSGPEAKGMHIPRCPCNMLTDLTSRSLTATACPHLNQRVPHLQLIPAISECPAILSPIDRTLRSHTMKPLLILPTLLLNTYLTVSRQPSMHSRPPQYLPFSCVTPRRAPRHLSMTATWNRHRHTRAYCKQILF